MAQPPSFVDHYKILELHHTASNQEIKQKFRKLSLQRHPDKDRHNPKAQENFVAVRMVFSRISAAMLTGFAQASKGVRDTFRRSKETNL
jgi:preprotein translocase subunit Sec63